MDLAAYRDEFPVLERKAYLISASLGPIGIRARARLEEYLEAWAGRGAPDHVWMEHIFPAMGDLKRSCISFTACSSSPADVTTFPRRPRAGFEI